MGGEQPGRPLRKATMGEATRRGKGEVDGAAARGEWGPRREVAEAGVAGGGWPAVLVRLGGVGGPTGEGGGQATGRSGSRTESNEGEEEGGAGRLAGGRTRGEEAGVEVNAVGASSGGGRRCGAGGRRKR